MREQERVKAVIAARADLYRHLKNAVVEYSGLYQVKPINATLSPTLVKKFEECFTDWKELFDSLDLDIIAIEDVVPNDVGRVGLSSSFGPVDFCGIDFCRLLDSFIGIHEVNKPESSKQRKLRPWAKLVKAANIHS